MDNYRIAFTSPGVAELEVCEVQHPKAGEVLVRLAVSTLSAGTERANLAGEVNITPNRWDTEAHFPRYSGYSSSGTIEEIGEGVTSVKVGDRVAVHWGSHSRFVCVSERNVHLIESEKVSFSEAALAFISTFPLASIRKCHLEVGESAMVMGVGILGRLAIKLLLVAGAVPVIAAARSPEKRAAALALGADYAFDPNDPDFAQKVREVTHGGVNVAIEVTGSAQALDSVLDCMAKMGRVSLTGCTRHSDFTIDYYHKVHGPGIALYGAHTQARPEYESSRGYWTHHDDIMAVLRLMAVGRYDLKDFVEETHSPREAPEVYARLMTEHTFPVVQFDWSRI